MKEIIICKRDELYDQVWAEPMRTVAKRYGISDVALAKICRKLRVPLPGRGYWAKKAAGHKLAVPKLPPIKDGQPTQHLITRPAVGVFPEENEAALGDADVAVDEPIIVPDAVEVLHPLVKRSEIWIRRAARPKSRVEVDRHPCLDVAVGEQTVDRAIRIADTLLKALDARGFAVEVIAREVSKTWPRQVMASPKTYVTGVSIHEEFVEFRISEGYDSIPVEKSKERPYGMTIFPRRPERERRANGKLKFSICNAPYGQGLRSSWSDGKVQRLETVLADIVHGMVVIARAMRAERLERERWQRKYDEEQRQREELRIRREEHERRVEDLTTRLTAWRMAREIDEFVEAMERHGHECSTNESSVTPTGEWIDWARWYATRLRDGAMAVGTHHNP